ncbi:MAG: DNA mismatch repair protein MutS [Polyangiaceae bacterium]|nr:DNA mismatch repair protein MutS [Polyangiaceae bacterium]
MRPTTLEGGEGAAPAPEDDAQRRVREGRAARIAALKEQSAALEERSRRLSLLRGLTFLAALAAGGYLVLGLVGGAASPARAPVAALAGVAAATFIGLVVAHARLVAEASEIALRITLCERASRRAAGDLSDLPARGDRFASADHDYAGDLDLFGHGSLFQLLSAAQTGDGEAALAAWLSAPASAAEVKERQEAVRELAALPAFREDLAVLGAQAEVPGREADPLIAWAEAPAPLAGANRPPALLAARILVPLTLAGLAASQLFGAQIGLFRHAWLLPLIAQVIALGVLRPIIEPTVAAAASREAPFGRYRPALAFLEQQSFSSPLLQRLQAELRGDGAAARASEEMRALQRILGYAELRHSGLVHLFAGIFLLWDVWCALALDRWRVRAGVRVRAWIRALGQLEALSSLAAFAHDNPDFVFPEVHGGDPHFEAEGLGHPLVPRARRVVNDVSLRGAGAALLVTGSNMSGKSTLLRAMGVNAALALAGAPVCAARLSMSPLAVRTSMRISDSLERGVSHFYAELSRLKRVVESADRGEPVLFLLDEILHGTNSRERLLGARSVVKHLIEKGAIGAVSSHDLGLADLEEETRGKVRNVHFEELVEGDAMTFDYKLKRGPVTSGNALRLMKMVGLPVDPPAGGAWS